MKKIGFFIIMFMSFLFINSVVYAENIIDKTNISKGLLYITYDGELTKKVKVTVECEGNAGKYDYVVKSNEEFSVPLQLGNGNYTVRILQNIEDSRYRILEQEKFFVEVSSPNDMFLASSPIVDYSPDMISVKEYSKILNGTKDEKIKRMYEKIVNDYVYDYDKAKTVAAGYVPAIDDIFKIKKGICYDYSALTAGVLRYQDVPVKLVMGYAPEINGYHAWNEIFMGGKWIVVDTTYDSAYAHAGLKYSMAKDASKFKIVKVY